MSGAHMRNAYRGAMRREAADAYATYVRTKRTDAEPLTRDPSLTSGDAYVRVHPDVSGLAES